MWSRENQVVYRKDGVLCALGPEQAKNWGWKYDIELNQNHPRVCKQHNKFVFL